MDKLLVKSVVPIWVLSLVGALLVGVLAPVGMYLVFLPVVLGALAILTFVVQLAMTRPEGFVDRVAASLAGSLVVLAIATAVLGPLSAVPVFVG